MFTHTNGEGFEFEMRMLLESTGKYKITEVKIDTIYDSETNHQTHFHPVRDSIKIYRVLGGNFIKYIFASCSSSIIDLILFSLFCVLLKVKYPNIYIVVATIVARIISAGYNYFMNYKLVFNSGEPICLSGMKYIVLAIIQMCVSAILVTLIINMLPTFSEVIAKIIIDIVLFFMSYYIQQKYIFG